MGVIDTALLRGRVRLMLWLMGLRTGARRARILDGLQRSDRIRHQEAGQLDRADRRRYGCDAGCAGTRACTALDRLLMECELVLRWCFRVLVPKLC